MKNILKIIKLCKPQHKWIFLAMVLIVVQAALQQATPITLKFVVDELSLQITGGSGSYERLIFLFTLIFAINLMGVFNSAANQRLGDFISSRLGRYLTETYYKKILFP